jgi:hypothetical protein
MARFVRDPPFNEHPAPQRPVAIQNDPFLRLIHSRPRFAISQVAKRRPQ